MNTTTKELEIMQTAERLRELGVPDSLNRWLKMTPEALIANQRARMKINKQVANGAPIRIEKKSRSTISAGHAANLDDAGKALLKEIGKQQEQAKKARLKTLKELKMATKTSTAKKAGPKEEQLRQARAGKPKPAAAAKAAPAKNIPAPAAGAAPARAAKKAGPKQAAAENARTPVSGATTALKPGTKLAKLYEAAVGAGSAGATEEELCKKLGGWKKCAVTLRRVCERVGATLTRNDGKFVVTPPAAK